MEIVFLDKKSLQIYVIPLNTSLSCYSVTGKALQIIFFVEPDIINYVS